MSRYSNDIENVRSTVDVCDAGNIKTARRHDAGIRFFLRQMSEDETFRLELMANTSSNGVDLAEALLTIGESLGRVKRGTKQGTMGSVTLYL